jgi:hypothetical protein
LGELKVKLVLHLWRGSILWVRDKRLIVSIQQAGIEVVSGCSAVYKMKEVKMRIIIGVLIGGGIGFLVGYFGKCASGDLTPFLVPLRIGVSSVN